MRQRAPLVVTIVVVAVFMVLVGNRLTSVEGQSRQEPRFAAVPGEKGGQDIFGGYDVVPNWPKPLSTVPGHDKWTWGAGQSVFAESPNRVFILQRGELPVVERPKTVEDRPEHRVPHRPAAGARCDIGQPAGGAVRTRWQDTGQRPGRRPTGVDYRWEHCIVVVNANGDIIEDWTQWDKMLRRPHAVYISPSDPEKHVWIVDDYRHAIFKFTNDGKRLVQTIGEPNVNGADDKHFYRPTFMAWLPDGTFFVADGYANTRVVKFDKNGKFLMTWGEKGDAGKEKRPGYFNNVHGIAVDPQTRRVFVNDRANGRVQVFDENGKYLNEWSFGPRPTSDVHMFIISGDRYLWAADRGTSKMVKYDLDGNFLYSWGTWGDFPGGFWGVHGVAVDQEGNFYSAAVDSGGAQKFRPRPGANPAFLVGKPQS